MDQQRQAGGERRLPVIGLIGGMGSGKSAVAKAFLQRGGRLISGDQLGHEALRQPAIRNQVVQRWSEAVLGPDAEIDRKKLGAIVFADADERKALELLVFPWIEKGFREQTAAAAADPNVTFIILDAAILLEAGWQRFCDRVVFVDAPRALRLRRLAEQRGWTEKEVTARENAQFPLSEKASRADAIIDNSGSLDQIPPQVDDLLRRWGLAAH